MPLLVVQVHEPRALAGRSQGMRRRVQIVSISWRVKLAESPVLEQCFTQRIDIAVDTRLDRLDYLMPADAQGTSRFCELI